MGRFLDGRVSAVVGTHTHTQTADEQIFPGGTAFLCDAGMCGPVEGVLGRDPAAILERYLWARPVKYPLARGPVVLHGALIDIDEESGRALHIERVVHRVCVES
jgi:calcineurin-like phosphoesterase